MTVIISKKTCVVSQLVELRFLEGPHYGSGPSGSTFHALLLTELEAKSSSSQPDLSSFYSLEILLEVG